MWGRTQSTTFLRVHVCILPVHVLLLFNGWSLCYSYLVYSKQVYWEVTVFRTEHTWRITLSGIQTLDSPVHEDIVKPASSSISKACSKKLCLRKNLLVYLSLSPRSGSRDSFSDSPNTARHKLTCQQNYKVHIYESTYDHWSIMHCFNCNPS